MTKRPSPFEPNIYRQSKIHLNNYENDVIALRDVQERTLRKLFEGPRKAHSIILTNGDDLSSDGNDMQSKDNLMQRLVTSYITVNGRKIKENGRILVSSTECPSSCFFCESKNNSTYQCVSCSEFYCSECSFVNYESLDDRRTCLSCS